MIERALRSTLVVECCPLHMCVPVFNFGVLHHVIKCLKAFHHSEDSEHGLWMNNDINNVRGSVFICKTEAKGSRVVPHQICQVGLIATHELPVLANSCHPVVDGLVQILPDVVLQVVSVGSKKENQPFVSKLRN